MRFQIILKLLAILLSFTSAYTWTTKDECPETIRTVVSSDPCAHGDGYLCTEEPQFRTMDTVHDALSHCPNLTALDLRVANQGCTEFPDRWDFPLSPWGGDRYANLTSLRIEGYDFGTRRVPSRRGDFYGHENLAVHYIRKAISIAGLEEYSQRFLKWAPFKSQLDLWLDAMDWSGIEELMIARITDEILEKVPPRLSSLKKLETSNMTFIETFPNNTLKQLTWIGEYEPHDFTHILERQGSSLEKLHFRLPERSFGPFLPDFNISMLPAKASNLTHVALNVPRNGTWPLDTLSIISSLPNLRVADIYMSLQSECAQQRPYNGIPKYEGSEYWREICSGAAQYQQPKLNKQGAEEMFEHMRQVKNGVELRNVTFYMGDWTRPWDGALNFPDWFDGQKDLVHCSLDNTLDDGWCDVDAAWNEEWEDWEWEPTW